jgi:hypothetical protein
MNISKANLIELDPAELLPGQRVIKEVNADGSVLYIAAGVGGAAPYTSLSNVYGVIYDANALSAADSCVKVELRGGVLQEVSSFSSMPAHQFRRCVISDVANRKVAYHLADDDSNFKRSGAPADLTGGDGDVYVEIPVVHCRKEVRDNGQTVFLVSAKPFAGSTPHEFFNCSANGDEVRTQYISAYKAGLCGANGKALWTSENSGKPSVSGARVRSVAGSKPWTERSYANWNALLGDANIANYAYYRFLSLMMLIEYGTPDSQAAFCDGFCNLTGDWNAVGLAYTRLSGRANFGNGSGFILADADRDETLPFTDGKKRIVQCCYRGIEDPFGGLAELIGGVMAEHQLNGSADNLTLRWTNAFSKYGAASSTWEHSFGKVIDAETMGLSTQFGAFYPNGLMIALPDKAASSTTGSCDGAFINPVYLGSEESDYVWSNSSMFSGVRGGVNAYRYDDDGNGEYIAVRLQI